MDEPVRHALELARSLIRDGLVYDYSVRELEATPQDVIARLTELLGDDYCPICTMTDGDHDQKEHDYQDEPLDDDD